MYRIYHVNCGVGYVIFSVVWHSIHEDAYCFFKSAFPSNVFPTITLSNL